MFFAISAVMTLASIVLALTSGAVRKARYELLVDLAVVLLVEILPGEIADRGREGDVFGLALRIGQIFGADGQVFGVVVAPVEAGCVVEPFVFAAAPQLGVGGAELVHGDLVGLAVAHQPL